MEGQKQRVSTTPISPTDANKLVEQQLDGLLGKLEGVFGTHVHTPVHALAFAGSIVYGVEDYIRDAVESRCPGPNKNDRLLVILETSGGYVEVGQRIADLFRHHYTVVDFLVPNYAMSAGTVLVMSGDSILMDYYSVLGPVDPQVQNERW